MWYSPGRKNQHVLFHFPQIHYRSVFGRVTKMSAILYLNSQGLCNHVTGVLDVPLAVLPDSSKFGSDILRNIQLITSYCGETWKTMGC